MAQLVEGSDHFCKQDRIDVAGPGGNEHPDLRCLARHHRARHPRVPALVTDGDQHVFEPRPLGGDGNAVEHLDAGGNLEWLAVIVGIAARWNEPAEFKIVHGGSSSFPRSLWRSSGYGRRQMLLCTGAHSVVVGASPVNNGHLDIGVPRPAQGRTRGTIVALDWIGDKVPLSRKGQLPTWRIAQMIHVIAVITAKPGMRDAILKEFRANVPAVHAEKGCIEYGPAIDVPNFGKIQTNFGLDTFVVIEKWEDADALKAHGAAPHMAAYAAKTKEMIASRVIHVLAPA